MRKKLLTTRNAALALMSVLLALCLAFGILLLPLSAKADDETWAQVPSTADVWDGDLVAAGWGASDGVQPAGYLVSGKTLKISSAAALAYFAHEVTIGANNGFYGWTVELACDIDLDGLGGEKIWFPIGSASRDDAILYGEGVNVFRGTFDGGNHTVYNISTDGLYKYGKFVDGKVYVEYNGTDILFDCAFGTNKAEYSYGLFGTTANAEIKNLNVVNVKFNMPNNFVGDETNSFLADNIGAIVGYATGSLTVTNCTAGSYGGSDLISDFAKSNVATGGLIGRIYSALDEDGNATGKVSHNARYALLYFENCTNYVDVVADYTGSKSGGITGYFTYVGGCTYKNCVNYGDITSCSAGGMTSYFQNQKPAHPAGNTDLWEYNYIFDNCINYGNIRGTLGTGGIYGSSDHYLASESLNTYYLQISGCKNYGEIYSDGEDPYSGKISYANAGGLVGYILAYNGSPLSVTDSYNYGNITLVNQGVAAGSGSDPARSAGGIIGMIEVNKDKTLYPNQFTISGGNSGSVSIEGNETCHFCNSIGYMSIYGQDKTISLEDRLGYINCIYFLDTADKNNICIINNKEANYETVTPLDGQYLDITDGVLNGLTAAGIQQVKELAAYSVEIPANVKEVAENAFAGEAKLAKVTFEQASLARAASGLEIGSYAFAGTSLISVDLPEGIKTVGEGAFVCCPELNYVNLPDNAFEAQYGEYAFGNSTFVIAKNSGEYAKLSIASNYLTYPVTIQYNYRGVVLDEEVRLHNQHYNLEYSNGRWVMNSQSTFVGTYITGVAQWYDNEECDGSVLVESGVTSLLKEEADVIVLYSVESGKKVFVAREDIVYSPDATYSMQELNPLLYIASDYITPSMVVTVTSYTDTYGNEAEEEDLPEEIHNAGEYIMQVVDGDDTYNFRINVAPAAIDIGNYANLSFRLNNVGSSTTDSELLNGDGVTLYVYSDGNGNEYYSVSVLTSNKIDELGLDGSYTTKTVLYSVVRSRDTEVTIGVKQNDAYSVVALQNNAGTVNGKYLATATLEANNNYYLTASNANSMRGLTVKVSEDGKTAEVTKDWYIAEFSNWLVDGSGAEYYIPDHIYGYSINADVPELYYKGVGGAMRMTLTLNGTEIGSFDSSLFDDYINSVMPAGNYKLTIVVEGVKSNELVYEDPEDSDNNVFEEVYHDGFTQTIEFTVHKEELPDLTALNEALKGKVFTYVWEENTAHLYDSEAALTVNEYLGALAVYNRAGTIWEDSKYDLYFGEFTITYNLARMQSDLYYAASDMTVSTADADKYTVYYQISAPNYVSSVEALAQGDSRLNYCFYVINIREVSLPVILSKSYNGEVQTADIADGLFYTVTKNEGGAGAGTYTVELTLREPDYYMWEGQTIDEKTATYTLNFVISKANNSWKTSLGITTWIVGEYSDLELAEGEFAIKAEAQYGNVILTLVNSADPDTVIYSNANGTQELDAILAGLKVGTYVLTATVAGSDDLYELTDFVIFQVFPEAGLAWWVTVIIVVGALLVVALVLFILHQKGVLQMLTGKVVIAMRTKATVDATIAAVRANKVAERAKQSIAAAEARDAEEARRKEIEAAKARPVEEQAAHLDAAAAEVAAKAEEMQKRAAEMQKRAAQMKEKASNTENTSEGADPADEE